MTTSPEQTNNEMTEDRQGECTIGNQHLSRIQDKILELEEFVKGNQNVHRQVKALTKELKEIAVKAIKIDHKEMKKYQEQRKQDERYIKKLQRQVENLEKHSDNERQEENEQLTREKKITDKGDGEIREIINQHEVTKQILERMTVGIQEVHSQVKEGEVIHEGIRKAVERINEEAKTYREKGKLKYVEMLISITNREDKEHIERVNLEQEREIQRRMMEQEKLEKLIGKEMDENALYEMVKKSWPEAMYKKCKLAIGDAPKEKEKDLIIVRREGDETDNYRIKRAIEEIPHLEEALKKNEEHVELPIYFVTDNKIIYGDDETQEVGHMKYTYVVTVKEAGTPKGVGNWWKALKRIKEIMRKNGRKKVVCVAYNLKSEETSRKLLEHVFRGTVEEMDVEVYGTTKNRRNSRRSEGGEENQFTRKGRTTKEETIFIKPMNNEGTLSYANTVRSMKEKVKVTGVQIKGITKTKEGEIQVRIKGEKAEEREAFISTLKEKMVDCASVVEVQRKTILLLDLDAATDEGEIVTELAKVLNIRDKREMSAKIQIAKKENSRGVKYAFVRLKEREAETIIKKGRIGEGWNRWRAREIVSVPKCFKCKKIGHTARVCEESEGEVCHKCGEMGHKIKECTQEQACYLCKKGGHRAESMKCPTYRKIVQGLKKKGTVFDELE
ncbi:uncharacterized protein LOC135137286 [Zophobas morio]|uniref:uncharacterized protein LOC135137286 n=1 Tax=Zophobas morio TaxID=2755281 RepID=UPI0030827CBE